MANGNVEPSRAEKKLIEHAVKGEQADFSGDGDRVIRGEVLRGLLLGLIPSEPQPGGHPPAHTAQHDIHHHVRSIRAKGVIIQGKLDLVAAIRADGNLLPPLLLECTEFKPDPNKKDPEGLDIDARLARLALLSLQDCKFTRIRLADAKVGGDVDLSGAGPLDNSNVCQILAQGCQVEGSFKADGCDLRTGKTEAAPGSTEIDYALNLTNARIHGDVSLQCSHKQVDCPPGQGAASDTKRPRPFRAQGVRLDLARVHGNVGLDGAKLHRTAGATGTEGYAFHAHNCRIEGSLFMSASIDGVSRVKPFQAFGCLSLIGARIDGNLDCRGAVLRDYPERKEAGKKEQAPPQSGEAAADTEWSYSLNARDATVRGDVLLRASRYGTVKRI